MTDLITVTYQGDTPTVSGRDLHEFLEVDTRYNDWIPRMCEYGFQEGKDFNLLKNERVQPEGSRMVTRMVDDHLLSIPMAKEICMIQRSEKGKIARQYFLSLEAAWNSPEAVMARALKMAQDKLNSILALNSDLRAQNAIMQPKADYFDDLVDRNLNTGVRETAKELQVKERDFVEFLIRGKYLYRTTKGKLMPYAEYAGDLFVLKETFNDRTDWAGTQLLITPRGRETFRLLFR